MDNNTKPPIGVMPKFVWDKIRRVRLMRAMLRYEEAGMHVPNAWVDELCELYELIRQEEPHEKGT